MKRISRRAGLRGLATMAVAVGMMGIGMSARAETVLSNLTATVSSTDYLESTYWFAQSFDTNAQAWTLNSVTVSSDGGNSNFNTGNFFLDVYDSTGSGGSRTPGALVGHLSGTDKPVLQQLYTYTAAGISLAPSSRYWVVFGVSSGNPDYNFNYAEDIAATGVWSYPYGGTGGGVVANSFNQGATWSLGNYGPFLLEFDATVAAVPEIDPASFGSALSLVLGALGLAERKRRVVIG
jgi:hypothetical protein